MRKAIEIEFEEVYLVEHYRAIRASMYVIAL